MNNFEAAGSLAIDRGDGDPLGIARCSGDLLGTLRDGGNPSRPLRSVAGRRGCNWSEWRRPANPKGAADALSSDLLILLRKGRRFAVVASKQQRCVAPDALPWIGVVFVSGLDGWPMAAVAGRKKMACVPLFPYFLQEGMYGPNFGCWANFEIRQTKQIKILQPKINLRNL